MEDEKRLAVTITLLPSVKTAAAKRAKQLKRSLSSHIEFLLEEDISKSKKAKS
jgi:hypothetical protein